MAPLPDTVTIHDLSGEWTLDKARSTGLEDCMSVQGMSWFLRKAVNYAKVTSKMSHKNNAIETFTKGTGVPVTLSETINFDWTERDKSIGVFGNVRTRNRPITLEQDATKMEPSTFRDGTDTLTDEDFEWLMADWIRDADGKLSLLDSQVMSLDGKWKSHQVWGFAIVDGKREQARKILVWTPTQKAKAFTIYEWLGPFSQ